MTHPIWITKVRRIGSPRVARRTQSVRPLISSSEQLFCGSLSPSLLYLSHSRLSPIRLLQFETEYISRSATSTDARQDKWLRDGGYITFQNWPNRRLSGDEKEGPRYIEPAGPYTCIDRRSAARRDEAKRGEARHGAAPRCIVFSALPQRPLFLKIHRRHAFQTAQRFSSVDFLIRKRAPLSYDEARKMEEKERRKERDIASDRIFERDRNRRITKSPRCYIIYIAVNIIPPRYNVFN